MPVARNSARVGAAAFVLGLSLAGPAVAAADTADGRSASQSDQSSPTAPKTAPKTAPVTRAARSAAAPAAPAASVTVTRSAGSAGVPKRTARADSQQATARVRSSAGAPTAAVDVQADARAKAASDTPATPDSVVTPAATPTADPVTEGVTETPVSQRTAARVAASTAATVSAPIGRAAAASSPLDFLSNLFAPIQGLVEAVGLLIRRAFFNEAPTVSPVQTSGQVVGPITGTVGAIDPEGDPITYSITQAPAQGSVSVASDGTYTYTPGPGFTGLDGFTIAAADGGWHINLLDLFRPAATDAYMQVAQNPDGSMLTFAFIYGSGSQNWTQEARNALQTAAVTLASYLVVDSPVTITYDVTATSDSFSSTLASAGSDLTGAGAGFFDTVVQQKILTGTDSNGSAADGQIDWNFGRSWGYGASVAGGSYDFTSTAMHELLHTFGFLSYVDAPGNNTGQSWTTFDRYITTSGGTPVIDRTTFLWNTGYDTNLTGGGGGLYFDGTNAVAAYGGPVPLYTPNPWEPGSSVSHLRDSAFTGANEKLMNAQVSAGTGVRIVSAVELAMLKDIGYTVSNTPIVAFMIVGFRLVRRRAKTG